MRKSHFLMSFYVVGAHNQQVFCIFKWGKKPKQQRVFALVLSLWIAVTVTIWLTVEILVHVGLFLEPDQVVLVDAPYRVDSALDLNDSANLIINNETSTAYTSSAIKTVDASSNPIDNVHKEVFMKAMLIQSLIILPVHMHAVLIQAVLYKYCHTSWAFSSISHTGDCFRALIGHGRIAHSLIGYTNGAHTSSGIEDSALEDSALGESALEDNALEDSALEDSALEDSALEDSALEDSALEDSALEDSALEDSALEDSALEDSAIEDRALIYRPHKGTFWTSCLYLTYRIPINCWVF